MRDDALPIGRLLRVAGLFAAIVVVAIVAALALTRLRGLPAGGVRVATPTRPPAEQPSLQTAPQEDLAAYRREQAAKLSRLGWIDGASGLVQVPIDAAMDRLAAPGASAPAALAPSRGASLPVSASFLDSSGRAVRLGDELSGSTPVLLAVGYDHCPQLCGFVLQGALEAAHATGLAADAYRLLFVSIDPRDTPADAAARRRVELAYARYVAGDGAAIPALDLLVGPPASIDAVTRAVGYRYTATPGAGDTRYAHPAALFVVEPDGRLARTFGGVRYDASELRAALTGGATEPADSVRDRIALICAHLDPRLGRWSTGVLDLVRGLAIATLAALVVLAWRMRRRGTR